MLPRPNGLNPEQCCPCQIQELTLSALMRFTWAIHWTRSWLGFKQASCWINRSCGDLAQPPFLNMVRVYFAFAVSPCSDVHRCMPHSLYLFLLVFFTLFSVCSWLLPGCWVMDRSWEVLLLFMSLAKKPQKCLVTPEPLVSTEFKNL